MATTHLTETEKDRIIADLAYAVRSLYEGGNIDPDVSPRLHRAVGFALAHTDPLI